MTIGAVRMAKHRVIREIRSEVDGTSGCEGAAHAPRGAPEMCPPEEDLRLCPSEEDLRLWAEIDDHLRKCDRCSEALERMDSVGAKEIGDVIRCRPPISPRPQPLVLDLAPDPVRQAAFNLLFGLLALRNNFISRENLLAAFAAWVDDKALSLAQFLVDRGAIDGTLRAVLEALVAKHLDQHGGDLEASLAVIGSLVLVRDDLERLGDPDLQTSLTAIAPQSTGSGGSAGLTATGPPSSRRAGERFRILRIHSEGGLGRVYVAYDEELGREVALKEIRPDRVRDHLGRPVREEIVADLRGRFILEAEINGGLEHPGIIPVYSLDTYNDGMPFYVMRFVKGDNLKEAIASTTRTRGLAATPASGAGPAQLLRRFIDVCNAIAYAAQPGRPAPRPQAGERDRRQVRRDAVDRLGSGQGDRPPRAGQPEATNETATLVPPSGSGHADASGAGSGTPAYMSPEQAAGKVESLGSATDIYGLGAILYEMLTRQPPVGSEGTHEEVQDRARGARSGGCGPSTRMSHGHWRRSA